MKIKLSKSQWAFIGKKTGWIKEAQIFSSEESQEARKMVQDQGYSLDRWQTQTLIALFNADNYPIRFDEVNTQDANKIVADKNEEMKSRNTKMEWRIVGQGSQEQLSEIKDRIILQKRPDLAKQRAPIPDCGKRHNESWDDYRDRLRNEM